ncbi:MAG: phage tail tape measure protein [Pseudomonadota bacterium]|nr:phage tail tape measure protein [Pseudomonadota bacterium]
MDKLQLEVLLKAIDQVTAPLKSITGASGEAAKAVREAKGALKELENQQGLIDKFRDTSKWVGTTGNQLKVAQEKVRELKLEMDATDEPTRKMARAFEAAKKEAGELKDKHGELIAKQQTLRAALGESGISTTDMASHQKRLKTDIAAATGEVERQSTSLGQHNEKMRALNAAQAEYRKSIDFRNKLATGGAVTMATGAAMGMPFLAASREYGDFEQSMMGVAKQMEGARDANGNVTQSYHEMARAIKAMSEEIPMAANEIAAIVEAGARMGIQGKENLLTYARQTAIMSSALDLSVEQTGMNMATIAGLYEVPIANIKELGDTINWLDDNAKSSSGDIIDVMKRVAGTMSGVMDYRQTAALASTFLSLGSRAEVAASATNAMVRELSVANMQADRFQDGMKLLKLDSMEIQSGMATDATGTIIKVLEAIKALPKERQIEGATRIFGKEFGDDAAKLANNLDEYRKQLGWVKDAQAKGSMDREMGSQLKGQKAQQKLLSNALDNLASDIGGSLKGPLVALIGDIRGVIQAIRDWTAAHPTLVSVLSTVGAGIAAVTTAAGALAIGVAGLLGPFAAAKLAMTKLGVASPALVGKLGAILGPIGKITAAFTAGYAAGTLLNDGITALLTKLTGKNTNLGFWIYDLVQAVKAKYAELTAWLKKLPAEMAGIGHALIDGIIGGIKARMAALKSTVTGVGHETVAWLKNTLGIKSPSRVFEELGIYTMKGLEQGISGGQGAPLAAIARIAKQMGAAGAGMMLSTGAALANIDHRPPLAGGAMGGGYTIVNQITINAAPGMNERTLAEEVARQIDMIERAKAARGRSLLGDRA